jgi:dihydrofolate reductase
MLCSMGTRWHDGCRRERRREEGVIMRKIVAGLIMSLDGVVGDPQDWHFPYLNDEFGAAIGAQTEGADTLLLGRVTYEGFAEYWPQQGDDVPLATRMNTVPKLVASTTLKTVAWQNSTLIAGDVAEELTKLKAQPGKNISITGSIKLVRSLLRAGVLDELMLLVHPIVVGKGLKLFEEIDEQIPLKLAESKTFSTGVLCLTYVPAPRE